MSTVDQLTCDHLREPLGIDEWPPRLGWVWHADRADAWQQAYQIQAGRDRDRLAAGVADLWDSGRVQSAQSQGIVWAGPDVGSAARVWWRVRVWGGDGSVSPWSAPSWFETGLRAPEEVRGAWIGHPAGGTDDPARPVAAPYLRRAFAVPWPVVKARVYFSGLGYGELRCNGIKIGDAVLDPGFTRYDCTVLYRVYDVTDALTVGENVLGVVLGNGWYNCFTEDVWMFRQAPWRAQPKLWLRLTLWGAGGEQLEVVSGPDWRCTASPIVLDGVRNGETYDARREQELAGWDQPGYDDRDWERVRVLPPPGGVLRAQVMPPIRVTRTWAPRSVRAVGDHWVVDFGQNLAGWARLTVQAPAGHAVTLRYGERVDADGELDTREIAKFVRSGAFQTDRYLAAGTGAPESWEPRFTYHGFQYLAVHGLPAAPSAETVAAREVHTDLAPRGQFRCANELLNAIQAAAQAATRSNYHSIPTDCPHREKNGWTGDAALSAEQVLWNWDAVAAYAKWLQDVVDAQRPSGQLPGIVPTGGWGYNWGGGPAWDSALWEIPWQVYRFVGDRQQWDAVTPALERYAHFAQQLAVDGVVDWGLGDWCPPTGGPSGHACPQALTSTAVVYQCLQRLAVGAGWQGRPAAQAAWARAATAVREGFRRQFWDARTQRVVSDSQTAVAAMLYFGLADADETAALLDRLLALLAAHDDHLDTGILGAKYVMHVLAEWGRNDVAYRVASQQTFPSWGHWIAQGATTLWEQWDGSASRNHHMFSDISAWFYEGAVGLAPELDEPGFRHTWLRPPLLADLAWAEAEHASPYGRLAARWERRGERWQIGLTVPANTHATVVLPQAVIRAMDGPAGMTEAAADGLWYGHVGSGEWQWVVTLAPTWAQPPQAMRRAAWARLRPTVCRHS